jgi:hypothetical protein
VRVNPATAERQEDTEPLPWTQDLALAVPPNAQNKDSLQVTDDVEGQCAGTSDDQELGQIVHGSHDARCARAPEDLRRDLRQVRDGIEKRNKGNEEADGDRGLVEEELWWGDGEVFNLLADPDLVEGGGAEGEGCDDNTEELGLGSLVDGEGHSNAGCYNGSQHVPCDLFAEQDEVDQDDGRGSHDFGQLVETDRVEGQGQIAENNVAGEEAADGQHVQPIKTHSLEGAEGTEGGDEEDEAGCSEMPHDYHELAFLDLGIAEDSALVLAMSWWRCCGYAYFLLRKIRPSVDSVLSAIQKHVISFSLSGSGAGSVGAGFST